MNQNLLRKTAFLGVLLLGFFSCESMLKTEDEENIDDKTTAVYTVTYYANGSSSGTVPVDSSSYLKGQTVTVLGNTGSLAKTGYEWKGWNTASDGTGTTYAAGASFAMGGANVRLYAKWGLPSGVSLWARTNSAAAAWVRFTSIAADSSGNIYAAGYVQGAGTCTFGGSSINPTYAGYNGFVVKYDSSGSVLWATTVVEASAASSFSDIAIDSSGNIYVAGYQGGSGFVTYKSGEPTTGGYAGGDNAVIVKYDTSGSAIWARTTTYADYSSEFLGVAVDSSDNVYAVGKQITNGNFDYGCGTTTGMYTTGDNAVIVKYDSSGTAQRAQTLTTAAPDFSIFSGIAADSYGNVYVAGQIGSGDFNFNGAVTTGYAASNAVVAKYDSTGTALWAKAPTTAPSTSNFMKVAVDSSGNVYAVGDQYSASSFVYGGTSVPGSSAGENAVIVKFDSTGTGQWGRAQTGNAADGSIFYGLALDSSGNAYATGMQTGNSSFTYGGLSVTGSNSSGDNSLIVKLSPSGTGQWAKSFSASTGPSYFNDAAADNFDHVYIGGMMYGTGPFTDGSESASGSNGSGYNALIVQYAQ